MLLSCDYVTRLKQAQERLPPPTIKDDIVDVIAEPVFRREGRHLRMADVSRCINLSDSFISTKLSMFSPSLLYLDISYTVCSDILYICEHLLMLKSLNIAGLQLSNASLEGIQHLQVLEVLSIRLSNIKDIRALSACECVRSLDLGETTIVHGLSSLIGRRRLEELFLDCTTFHESLDLFEPHLKEFVQLKLLNLQEGSFENWASLFLTVIPHSIYFEKYPRRLLFLEAVINNQIDVVYDYLSSGQDINIRAKNSDQEYFTALFNSRCTYPRSNLQTPYFLFREDDDTDEHLLPTGLHLAVFFNCYDCVQLLSEYGADRLAPVLITEVLPSEDGQLEENQRESDNPLEDSQRRQIVHAADLAQICYDRNVHRITEQMIQKKVTNFKSICERIKKRLLYAMDIGGKKRMTKEELDKRASFAIDMQVETPSATHTNAAPSIMNSPSVSPMRRKNSINSMMNGGEDDSESMSHRPRRKLSISFAGNMPIEDHEQDIIAAAMKAVAAVESGQAKAANEKGKTPIFYPPPRPETRLTWRDHAMVKKVMGPAQNFHIDAIQIVGNDPNVNVKVKNIGSPAARKLSALVPSSPMNRQQSMRGGGGGNASPIRSSLLGTSLLGGKSPMSRQGSMLGNNSFSRQLSVRSVVTAAGAAQDDQPKGIDVQAMGKKSHIFIESYRLIAEEKARKLEKQLQDEKDEEEANGGVSFYKQKRPLEEKKQQFLIDLEERAVAKLAGGRNNRR